MRVAALAIGGLVALVACEPPPQKFPREIAWESEHLRVSIDEGLEICGRSLEHMDAFVTRVAEALGIPLEGRQFTFYWQTYAHFLARAPCPETVTGCAGSFGAVSQAAPNDHEFIHIIVSTLGFPPSFFSEGLAVAYELPILFDEDMWLPSTRDPREVLDEHVGLSLSWKDYVLAGAFTRFVIDRHGIATFLEFYGAGERDDTLAEIEEVYHAVFGETLAVAIADFQDERLGCPMGGFRFKLTECAADELDWDEQALSLVRSLDCGQDDVIGPFEDGTVRWYARFTVSRPGVFRVQAVGDPDGVVALGACGGCAVGVHEVLFAGEPERSYVLPAGQFHVGLISRDPASVVGVGVAMERVQDL